MLSSWTYKTEGRLIESILGENREKIGGWGMKNFRGLLDNTEGQDGCSVRLSEEQAETMCRGMGSASHQRFPRFPERQKFSDTIYTQE